MEWMEYPFNTIAKRGRSLGRRTVSVDYVLRRIIRHGLRLSNELHWISLTTSDSAVKGRDNVISPMYLAGRYAFPSTSVETVFN